MLFYFIILFCETAFLLFDGFALKAINDFHRAVPFAPVDPVGGLPAVGAVCGHGGHQADVWAHHAVKHGQLRGDSFNTLAHRDLHTANFLTARVTCKSLFRVQISAVSCHFILNAALNYKRLKWYTKTLHYYSIKWFCWYAAAPLNSSVQNLHLLVENLLQHYPHSFGFGILPVYFPPIITGANSGISHLNFFWTEGTVFAIITVILGFKENKTQPGNYDTATPSDVILIAAGEFVGTF